MLAGFSGLIIREVDGWNEILEGVRILNESVFAIADRVLLSDMNDCCLICALELLHRDVRDREFEIVKSCELANTCCCA